MRRDYFMLVQHEQKKTYTLSDQKIMINLFQWRTMSKPYNKQIGGSHYQKYKIQPSKFVIENKLLYPEGCAIKYIIRHQDKGKKQDILKAIHFLEMIIERDYK